MYNVTLIDMVFSTAEILVLPKETTEALVRLMDDKLAGRFLLFFKEIEELELEKRTDPFSKALLNKYQEIKEIAGSKVKQMTFHLELRQSNIFDIVKNIDINTAHDLFIDKDKMIEMLEWLFANRDYWCPSIEPRHKEDWEELLSHSADIEALTGMLCKRLEAAGLHLDRFTNIRARLKDNKDLFYSPNERSRKTGMGLVVHMSKALQVVLHGFKFQKLCNVERITQAEWRTF